MMPVSYFLGHKDFLGDSYLHFIYRIYTNLPANLPRAVSSTCSERFLVILG